MSLHDRYLRLTPLERCLPDPDFADRHLEPIANEARERGLDPGDPGVFAMLDATGVAVDELRRDEDGAEQRHRHALLLFHVWHLLRSGREHLLASTGVVRAAVEVDDGWEAGPEAAKAPEDGWPEGSRYLQLPQHLVWVREESDSRPDSLDGWFETRSGDHLTLMGVLGVMGSGPGFRVLPLPPLPLSDVDLWRTETIRESGDDFRSSMPGAELEGLYELRTAGELLKLAARIRRLTARQPHPQGGADSPTPTDGEPTPSALAFTRLV